MNILFLTLLDFNSLEEKNIYTDLLREFYKNGHNICVISPVEKKHNVRTHLLEETKLKILKLKIGNIQKTNYIEKGISMLCINKYFIDAIDKYFGNIKFDLILYTTPPIMICDAIAYVKKRDKAQTYLLLKDIFPQNAVDLGVFTKSSLFYKYYRKKEKNLYAISDHIGCMSPANVKYIIEHNPDIDPNIVEICPNSIDVLEHELTDEQLYEIRKKYDIPFDKIVYVYGGNIGRPQGIDFLIECLKSQEDNEEVFFLIVGNGTEFYKLQEYIKCCSPSNVKVLDFSPKNEFEKIVQASDVGMLFLDYRFSIPNFPSRVLSYMHAKKPVLAVVDNATDIGEIAVENKFAWCWCESNEIGQFSDAIKMSKNVDLEELGNNAYSYLKSNYSTQKAYEIIMRSLI